MTLPEAIAAGLRVEVREVIKKHWQLVCAVDDDGKVQGAWMTLAVLEEQVPDVDWSVA